MVHLLCAYAIAIRYNKGWDTTHRSKIKLTVGNYIKDKTHAGDTKTKLPRKKKKQSQKVV
jgi:hypothetical protein